MIRFDDIVEGAHEAYRYRLLRTLQRRDPNASVKKWKELSALTREAWGVAVATALELARPREEVLRELAMQGKIQLRVEV